MTGPAIPPAAVQAAAEALERLHNLAPRWAQQLALAALEAAEAVWPHDRPERSPESRPVYVLAVGHDLDAADAENIQRAVVAALRDRKEAPDGT